MTVKKIVWEHFDITDENSAGEIPDSLNETEEFEQPPYDDSSPFPLPPEFMGGDPYENTIFTPLGVFHKNDCMNPSRHYDFWIGHTNFKITTNVIRDIENVPGVELVNPYWTSYRFLIAPGKAFEWRDVRIALEKILCGNKIKTKVEDEVKPTEVVINENITSERFKIKSGEDNINKFSRLLNKEYKYWVLSVDSTDTCEYYASNIDKCQALYDAISKCVSNNDTKNILSENVLKDEYYNKACGA